MRNWGDISWGEWGDIDCATYPIDPNWEYYQNPRSLSEKAARNWTAVAGNRAEAYREGAPTSKGEAMQVLETAYRQASLDGPLSATAMFSDAQSSLFRELNDDNIASILNRSLAIYARGLPECNVEPSVFAAGYIQGKLEALGQPGLPMLRYGMTGALEEPFSPSGSSPAAVGTTRTRAGGVEIFDPSRHGDAPGGTPGNGNGNGDRLPIGKIAVGIGAVFIVFGIIGMVARQQKTKRAYGGAL